MLVSKSIVISPAEFANRGKDNFPFSPGILHGDTLYVSGEIGADLRTWKVPEDFEAEVRTCFHNIELILKAADMDFSNIVSVQVYMKDMSQFQRMNAVYASIFEAPRPARVTVGVTELGLSDARIEVSVIAKK